MSKSLRRESAARLFQEADLERSSPGRDASRTIELRPEQPSLTQGMGQDRGRVDPGHRAEPPRRSSPQDEDETEVCWVSRQQQQALPVLPSPLYDPLRPWCHWSRYLRWTEVPYPREPETGGRGGGKDGVGNSRRGRPATFKGIASPEHLLPNLSQSLVPSQPKP